VNRLADEPLYYRYATSLHWSLAHFAPGTMTMQPENSAERSYAILLLVFGMIVFAAFTAALTNKMIRLRDMHGETSKQFWLLRRYLRERSVPSALVFRILRYTEYACASQEDVIQESSVTILSLLSDQLRAELMYTVSFSSLLTHPLFEEAHATSEVAVYSLAEKVLMRKSLASQDCLFEEGLETTHMYYIVSGSMSYIMPRAPEVRVEQDAWLCEHALWVPWSYHGDAMAVTECPVIYVDVHAWGEAIRSDARLWVLMAGYADKFADWLNEVDLAQLTDYFAGEESSALVRNFIPSREEQNERASAEEEKSKRRAKRETQEKERLGKERQNELLGEPPALPPKIDPAMEIQVLALRPPPRVVRKQPQNETCEVVDF